MPGTSFMSFLDLFKPQTSQRNFFSLFLRFGRLPAQSPHLSAALCPILCFTVVSPVPVRTSVIFPCKSQLYRKG